MKRRSFLTGTAALAALPTLSFADGYPSRSVRLVIPFSPGGGTDTFGRIIAGGLQAELGQAFVPDNKPGAGGNIGADMVAKAAPDGYTLLLAQDSLTIVPWLYKSLPFDVMKDFAHIGIGVYMPMVLVASRNLPAKDLKSLIEYTQKNPGKLSYGSPGVGTAHHLNFENFLLKTGTKMTHVPYKGAASMNADLIAGNVDVAFTALSSALPLLSGEKLQAIAVGSAQRVAQMPALPTMAETLPGYEAHAWFGLSAPNRTPDAVIEKLSGAMQKVLQKPEISKRLSDQGYRIQPTTPPEMVRVMRAEYERWRDLSKKVGIVPE